MRRGLVIFLAVVLFVPFLVAGAAAAPPDEPVSVIGPFWPGGPEHEALMAELGTLKQVEIDYEYLDDAEAILARIAGEDPPDIVIVPWPPLLAEFADSLVDLTRFSPEVLMRRDFGDYLVDLGSFEDRVIGAPVKMDFKTLVWYKPAVFAEYGYAIPSSFTELVALSDRMVADGFTPWCQFMASGFATGWLGTDWIEDLLLGKAGPDVYDRWITHDVLFQDPLIADVFATYRMMLDTPGYVLERGLLLDVDWFVNVLPLDDEACLMHRQATFFRIAFDAFGIDMSGFDTFKFPSMNPAYEDAIMGGGNYVAALDDRPAVAQVMRFVLGPRFGRTAIAPTAADTGWLLANTRFDTGYYVDAQARSWADLLQASLAADLFRLDASDLMPPEIGSIPDAAFWVGIRDLVNGEPIPLILQNIDNAWP